MHIFNYLTLFDPTINLLLLRQQNIHFKNTECMFEKKLINLIYNFKQNK